MRRILCFLIFLITLMVCQGKIKAGNVDNVAFDKVSYNFGDVVNSDGVISTNFMCQNNTSSALVILAVKTSCSCLKGRFSRKPIPPGAKTSIALFLETSKMEEGIFHRVIQVKTNSGVYHLTVQGVKRR